MFVTFLNEKAISLILQYGILEKPGDKHWETQQQVCLVFQ